MTLDTYVDLFDGGLDAVSEALETALSQSNVGKCLKRAKQKAPVPLQIKGIGAFSRGGDGGI